MAMTATISCSPSTVKTEQKCIAAVTISNSAAYPVDVTTCQVFAKPTSSGASNYGTDAAVGVVNTGPNVNLTVPASGSLVLTVELKFHGPSTASASNKYDNSGSNTYDVGALITSNDGSVFSPTATTVTANYVVSFS